MATSTSEAADSGSYVNVQIQTLQKNIRSINKKLASMQKTDSVIAENPNVLLDELVAQRKINADQRASALKKPGLQAQLSQLEEQVTQYKKLDAEAQSQLQKQEKELTAKHQQELEKIREEAKSEAVAGGEGELKKKLLVFSQFLRAAAARRNSEEDAELPENKAFEGALLLVYGGDQKAVDTAVSLIEGTDEQVLSIEGSVLPVKYSQVKQASIDHSPFQAEESWVDQVAEANNLPAEAAAASTNGHEAVPVGSDPTTTHAGLTELNPPQTNGIPESHDLTSPVQGTTGEAGGNLAGERWNTGAGAGVDKEGLDESFEMVPRPNEEVDNPAPAPVAAEVSQHQQSTSWADEVPAYAEPPAGNKAGEAWDVKAPGQEAADDAWTKAETPAQPDGGADDGFHEVPGRPRGRGGFRGRGDGESRGGRGRGGRGRGGPRGGRGDGEFRGRGGRGRGQRGGDPIRS